MFIATPSPMPIGSKLSMYVEHPVAGTEYALEAEVRWTQSDGPEAEWGMGVRVTETEAETETETEA